MYYYIIALIVLGFNLVKVDYDMDDFIKLYALQGEWTMPYKDGELVEKWEKKYNKMLEGETFYLKGEEKFSEESIKLFLRDGRIFYTPNVNGQNNNEPVPFTLVEIDKNKFIFENKKHDFPQRIIYEIKSDHEYVAVIEGETGKGYKKVEYKFRKKTEDF